MYASFVLESHISFIVFYVHLKDPDYPLIKFNQLLIQIYWKQLLLNKWSCNCLVLGLSSAKKKKGHSIRLFVLLIQQLLADFSALLQFHSFYVQLYHKRITVCFNIDGTLTLMVLENVLIHQKAMSQNSDFVYKRPNIWKKRLGSATFIYIYVYSLPVICLIHIYSVPFNHYIAFVH